MGSPAFGYTLTRVSAIAARSDRNGRICWAPSAQLIPTVIGLACATLIQNASTVCPLSVRPLWSVIVTEIISGSSVPSSRCTSSIAISAALQLSVSKIVSHRSRSTPPSISPRTCSAYASRTCSKLTAR